MANVQLSTANKIKNDEFYTRLTDIEKELKHYKSKFKNKHVFCNCDDPEKSNFWRYFALNFKHLGIKQLTATHYNENANETYRLDMYKDLPEDANDRETFLTLEGQNIDLPLGYITKISGDGDFRSNESKSILKDCDIVVTNPPFSLFREYISQLIHFEKNFIVLGNMNAITYKEIFPLLESNQMWLGAKSLNTEMLFDVPDKYKKWLVENKKEGSAYKILNNVVMGRLASACWFTNVDLDNRHEDIIMYKKYNDVDNPHYDNYDAIDVSRVNDIPNDYFGPIGVPLTFMGKYNPDQFDILGIAPERLSNKESRLKTKQYINAVQHNKDGTVKNGNKVNDGPTLIHDSIPSKFPYYTSETVPGKYISVLYARIIIKRK